MGKSDSLAVAGAWSCAQTLHRSQGFKSALVSLDRDVRQLIQSGSTSEALQLIKKTLGLCSAPAVSPADAIAALRQTKALLDLADRNTQETCTALFPLHLLTANSLASAFKSAHDLHQAYVTLIRAIELIRDCAMPQPCSTLQYMASTLVNCSTVQLDLKLFPQAVKSAEHCLQLLHCRFSRVGRRKKDRAMIQSYGAALFNLAVAEEAMGNRQDALRAYVAFVQFADKCEEFAGAETVSEAETAIQELQCSLQSPALEGTPDIPALPRLSLTQRKATLPIGFSDRPKYYSAKRLAQLHAMIARGSKSTFMGPRDFFGLQVRKELNLGEESKPSELWGASNTAKSAETDRGERKGIVKLRERKYRRRIHMPAESRGVDYVYKRISLLQKEVRPAPHSPSPRTVLTTRTPSPHKSGFFLTALQASSAVGYQTGAKEEIEHFMSAIQANMKSVDSSPSRKVQTPQPGKPSELAKSVLRPREEPTPPTHLWKGLVSGVLKTGEDNCRRRRATVSFRLHKETEPVH